MQIRETPNKRHHKFIEFYDVRAAEAALKALNGTEIAGKRIKLEPSRPGGARRKYVLNATASASSFYYPLVQVFSAINVLIGNNVHDNNFLFYQFYNLFALYASCQYRV